MSWAELLGFLGVPLIWATFFMRTMVPLRIVAICSNIVGLGYGALSGLKPVILVHLMLLPLNCYRTYEMLRLLKRVQRASQGDLDLDWLKPFMKTVRYAAGHVLFPKGAPAERLFLIIDGGIRLDESGKRLGPGQLVGEIGFFAPKQQRTQTARCETAVELLWIDQTELAQLCYQNPGIAFHLLRLITARLVENCASSAPAGAAADAPKEAPPASAPSPQSERGPALFPAA